MSLNAQEEWILEWLRKHRGVDVLDTEFHDEFSKKFNVKQKFKMWGAAPCPTAMRYLKKLYDKKCVTRARVGISAGEGFPSWVWDYRINE